MSDLYWPGDDRAGEHFDQEAFVRALVDVEEGGSAACSATPPTCSALRAARATSSGWPTSPSSAATR